MYSDVGSNLVRFFLVEHVEFVVEWSVKTFVDLDGEQLQACFTT